MGVWGARPPVWIGSPKPLTLNHPKTSNKLELEIQLCIYSLSGTLYFLEVPKHESLSNTN
jgi:hypothetical protein